MLLDNEPLIYLLLFNVSGTRHHNSSCLCIGSNSICVSHNPTTIQSPNATHDRSHLYYRQCIDYYLHRRRQSIGDPFHVTPYACKSKGLLDASDQAIPSLTMNNRRIVAYVPNGNKIIPVPLHVIDGNTIERSIDPGAMFLMDRRRIVRMVPLTCGDARTAWEDTIHCPPQITLVA